MSDLEEKINSIIESKLDEIEKMPIPTKEELDLQRSALKCSYGMCSHWLKYYDALAMLEHDKVAFEYSMQNDIVNIGLITFKTRDSMMRALDECYAFGRALPVTKTGKLCRVVLVNKKQVKEYNKHD
jgi:hypothetical protein